MSILLSILTGAALAAAAVGLLLAVVIDALTGGLTPAEADTDDGEVRR